MSPTNWPRRKFLIFSAVSTGALTLTACGGNNEAFAPRNAYKQEILAASSPSYKARFTFPEMVNAWGIAIRPKGAGGHFWVTAGGKSWQFVGDATKSTEPALNVLFQDGLKEVTIPGADSITDDTSIGKATGTIFNGADINSSLFRVTGQTAKVGNEIIEFDGSARFIFVTDSGYVTAWTERAKSGAIVRVDGPAKEMFDGSTQDMAFFGVAIKPDSWNRLWLVDFGARPQIRTLDENWKLMDTVGFANPFATGPLIDVMNADKGKQPRPGDPVPFNIQVVGTRVFVTYCISRADKSDPSKFFKAEEDGLDAAAEKQTQFQPDKGKFVEYDINGKLLRIFKDDRRLNAPWGVAVAPSNFGKLSNTVLVGNFAGHGTIAAFNDRTGEFIDFMKTESGDLVKIPGLWALLFGNGESLGDSNALYFAAGPNDEKEGLFGSLRSLD